MRNLLVIFIISFCCSAVSAQNCGDFAFRGELTAAGTAEYIGFSMMSAGGCMLVAHVDTPSNSRRTPTFYLSGAALVVTGFFTYMLGAVHLSDKRTFKKKDSKPFID